MRTDILTKVISILVVLLLPFWALPFIPGSFKPLSIFLCIPLGIMFLIQILVLKKKVAYTDFLLLLFFLGGLLYSLLFFIVEGAILTNFAVGISLFIIGLNSYFAFKYILEALGVEKFLVFLRYSIFIVVIIGWIDLLGWLGLIPTFIRDFVNYAVAGKSSSRIILTVSEPAWASRLVVCLAPFAFLFWKRKKKLVDLFSLLSLLVFFMCAFSLSGFLLLFMVALFHLISRLSIVAVCKVTLMLTLTTSLIYVSYINIKDGGGYYVSRIDKIAKVDNIESLMTLDALAAFDGSALIRIGYPIISTQIFIENPFGIGIGRYGEYFNENIVNYGSRVTNDIQVAEHIENVNADQRSFYTKILTEHGILLSFLLLAFYVSIYKKLKRLSILFGKDALLGIGVLHISLLIVFANMVQFASYLFPFYWLIPALISICYEQKKII
jgi:hypothetical protein